METKFMKKNQNGGSDGCIRLCDLPNAILQHILTKLPTKDIVRVIVQKI